MPNERGSYWSQISKIVFGVSDEHRCFEKMGTQLHPKTTVVCGVLANEASELMKRFFARKESDFLYKKVT